MWNRPKRMCNRGTFTAGLFLVLLKARKTENFFDYTIFFVDSTSKQMGLENWSGRKKVNIGISGFWSLGGEEKSSGTLLIQIDVESTKKDVESRNFHCRVVLSASENKVHRKLLRFHILFRRFHIETDGPRKFGNRK